MINRNILDIAVGLMGISMKLNFEIKLIKFLLYRVVVTWEVSWKIGLLNIT